MKIKGLEEMSMSDVHLDVQRGGKFVIYQYCISVVLMTFRRGSDIYYIKAGESAVRPGLGFTLLTLLLGWWGIPWGPIYTVGSLINNFKGGKDVTAEVMAHLSRAGAQAQPPQPPAR